MKEAKLNEGVLLLSKLAGYLDELGQERSASWFRSCADELQGELSRKQISDVCRGVLLSLDNGPCRIPDLYFAYRNGEPDIAKTNEYLETIRAVRRFARKGV